MTSDYCPYCDAQTEIELVSIQEEYPIRKSHVTISAQVYKCKKCGNDFVTNKLEEFNYGLAVEKYRNLNGYLFPEDIKRIRETYGLSQRSFARFLGWSETIICSYEKGKLQDQSHNDELQLLKRPSNVAILLEHAKDRLRENDYDSFKNRIVQLVEEENKEFELNELNSVFNSFEGRFVGDMNFKVSKFVQAIVTLLGKGSLYKTKLLKLLFYADFLHYKRYGFGITGIQYVRWQFGPVPLHYEKLLSFLYEKEYARPEYVPSDEGHNELIHIGTPCEISEVGKDEQQTIADVVKYFSSWTAKQVSEQSHKETAFKKTRENGALDYRNADSLSLD